MGGLEGISVALEVAALAEFSDQFSEQQPEQRSPFEPEILAADFDSFGLDDGVALVVVGPDKRSVRPIRWVIIVKIVEL